LSISGISLGAIQIANAAGTYPTDDDFSVIQSALAGNDTIEGSDYNDRLGGFNGNDLIQAWGGNDSVYGGAGNDTLDGMAGNDALDGGTGVDSMTGGTGNDRFYVDNASDKVFEKAGGGSDAVYASVSFVLAAGQSVETFATTSQIGSAAINLTGNELAQTINGNNGANIINGGAGNDVISCFGGNDILYGGAGNDTLTGGAGRDAFAFNTAVGVANVDRITDFNVVDDTIRLENAVMPGLGRLSMTLSSFEFWKSTTGLAHDSNDRIIYETDTGKLFYDSNGSAAGGSVQIATLATNLALTNADFWII
jgi:serralysin